MYFNWIIYVLGYDFLTTHEEKVIISDMKIEYGNEIESHLNKSLSKMVSKQNMKSECKNSCIVKQILYGKINKKEVVTEGATSRNKKKFTKIVSQIFL